MYPEARCGMISFTFKMLILRVFWVKFLYFYLIAQKMKNALFEHLSLFSYKSMLYRNVCLRLEVPN